MTVRQPLPTAPSSAWRSKRLLERVGDQWRGAPPSPPARALLKRAYHAALSLQTGGRGLRATLPGGEIVRVCPEHRYLSWNPAEYEAFRRAVDPGAVALDVGANVGAYSVLLGQWVGPSGHVFAFEPEPRAFHGLSRHVALNRLGAIVHPISVALADREGPARLVVGATAGETRINSEAVEGAPTLPETMTRVTTVDRFCAERAIVPSFLKIDVEGLELAVLRGARDTIRRCRHLQLFVEMHPSIWPMLGITREDLLDEIARLGLVVESLVDTATTDAAWAVEGMCVRLRAVR
jgi:FkbM family methyltransferase